MFLMKASRIVVILLLFLLVLSLTAGSILGSEKVEPMVSAGMYHNLALKEDGIVWAWGYNSAGRLGDGTEEDREKPVQVKGPGGVGFLTDVVAISAGHSHSLALKSDGTVWAWGLNTSGQLGNGTTENSHTPVQVMRRAKPDPLPLQNVVAISAGTSHNLALLKDGTVMAWGWNGRGQLGDGTAENRTRAVPVKGFEGEGVLSDIVKVTAGDNHSLALNKDGNVWAWGCNASEQLGNNCDEPRQHTPVHVVYPTTIPSPPFIDYVPLDNIIAISAGDNHSLAVNENGIALAWGGNNHGQLGNDSNTDRNFALPVRNEIDDGPLDYISSVSAGKYYSLALTQGGSVWAWGDNDWGQLGDGSTDQRLLPVAVQMACYYPDYGFIAPLFNVNAISAGERISLAIREDFTSFWAWGTGYLGGNDPIFDYYPVRVDFPDECIVSLPLLTGPAEGETNQQLAYYAQGSTCSEGHNMQYRFGFRVKEPFPSLPGKFIFDDWVTGESHKTIYQFSDAGTYEIVAQARCELYGVISSSNIITVTIKDPYDQYLYASFADAVYAYDGNQWLDDPIAHAPALALAAHEGKLYGAFGDGIYVYDGTSWDLNKITPGVASSLASHDGKLYGCFADATYVYDGNQWTLFTWPTNALASYQGYLYASFSDAVYAYDGSDWIETPVAHAPALALAAHGGKLYGAFGDGIYVYDGTSWDVNKITPGVASNMASYDGKIYSCFVDATYFYDGHDWILFTWPTNALAAY